MFVEFTALLLVGFLLFEHCTQDAHPHGHLEILGPKIPRFDPVDRVIN